MYTRTILNRSCTHTNVAINQNSIRHYMCSFDILNYFETKPFLSNIYAYVTISNTFRFKHFCLTD